MQFESGPDTVKDAKDPFSNQKRTGELLEEEDSKKSKLDAGCDATLATDTSTSPKKPGSPNGSSEEEMDPSSDCRMESTVDTAWEKFQQSQENREVVPNLQAYLEAKMTREAAKKKFSATIDIFNDGLTQTMKNLLQHSVVAIHNEMEERLDHVEADIVDSFKSNHKRRIAMKEQMDTANDAWLQHYSQLCNRITPPEGSGGNPTNESKTRPTQMEGFACSNSAGGSCIIEKNNAQDAENRDLDWESLGDTPANQGKIQRFLVAREKFQNAAEVLSNDLDDIHAGLEAQVEAIMRVAIDILDRDEKSSLAFEEDIQYHLMENEKRRANLQKNLEDSAMQAQGLFANLLSRLVQN